MENMLDSPHVPYVHATTIGRFVRPFLKRDSTMHIEWEDKPYGGRSTSWVDGHNDRELATLDFYKPNIMVLNIPVPKQTFRMHAICVPVGPQAVRMLVVGARTFATFPLLNPMFNYSNMKIVKQDQAVVESSFPVEIPPPAEEVSVRTDKATLQFRKYYYDTLKPSTTPPRRLVRAAEVAA
jgi:phenylpropionate dioxygenase-like ring-hydroxylating dioxygenase large terminal subunit